MLLGKQSDVKRHLSVLHRTKIHVQGSESVSDATDTSLTGPGAIAAQSTLITGNYSNQDANPGQSAAQTTDTTGFVVTRSHNTPKSGQA
jgi:hypothetical protein